MNEAKWIAVASNEKKNSSNYPQATSSSNQQQRPSSCTLGFLFHDHRVETMLNKCLHKFLVMQRFTKDHKGRTLYPSWKDENALHPSPTVYLARDGSTAYSPQIDHGGWCPCCGRNCEDQLTNENVVWSNFVTRKQDATNVVRHVCCVSDPLPIIRTGQSSQTVSLPVLRTAILEASSSSSRKMQEGQTTTTSPKRKDCCCITFSFHELAAHPTAEAERHRFSKSLGYLTSSRSRLGSYSMSCWIVRLTPEGRRVQEYMKRNGTPPFVSPTAAQSRQEQTAGRTQNEEIDDQMEAPFLSDDGSDSNHRSLKHIASLFRHPQIALGDPHWEHLDLVPVGLLEAMVAAWRKIMVKEKEKVVEEQEQILSAQPPPFFNVESFELQRVLMPKDTGNAVHAQTLRQAVADRNLTKVRSLVDLHGPDVIHKRGKRGKTALYLAAQHVYVSGGNCNNRHAKTQKNSLDILRYLAQYHSSAGGDTLHMSICRSIPLLKVLERCGCASIFTKDVSTNEVKREAVQVLLSQLLFNGEDSAVKAQVDSPRTVLWEKHLNSRNSASFAALRRQWEARNPRQLHRFTALGMSTNLAGVTNEHLLHRDSSHTLLLQVLAPVAHDLLSFRPCDHSLVWSGCLNTPEREEQYRLVCRRCSHTAWVPPPIPRLYDHVSSENRHRQMSSTSCFSSLPFMQWRFYPSSCGSYLNMLWREAIDNSASSNRDMGKSSFYYEHKALLPHQSQHHGVNGEDSSWDFSREATSEEVAATASDLVRMSVLLHHPSVLMVYFMLLDVSPSSFTQMEPNTTRPAAVNVPPHIVGLRALSTASRAAAWVASIAMLRTFSGTCSRWIDSKALLFPPGVPRTLGGQWLMQLEPPATFADCSDDEGGDADDVVSLPPSTKPGATVGGQGKNMKEVDTTPRYTSIGSLFSAAPAEMLGVLDNPPLMPRTTRGKWTSVMLQRREMYDLAPL